jgi:NAD(P)-dependent dehydrogenase (short-subunit alcohol dehydrogenase family)
LERIERRTALVTGAASGIGLAIAEELLSQGARVVLTDWDAAALERECSRLGEAVVGQRLDVTDRSQWVEARRVAQEAFGPVEILVNNAGVAPDWHDLVDMPVEHFDRLISIMLVGVFNGIHTFGPAMRDAGDGYIVNMSSMAGLIGVAKQGAYAAAKWGVVGISEALSIEMAPYGVGVSVVCPARVRSRLLSDSQGAPGNLSDGIPAEEVGAQVVRAIRRGDFYVITHPHLRAYVQDRVGRLLTGFDQAATV